MWDQIVFLKCLDLYRGIHQPAEWDQIIILNCLDLYHTSPDSGECQYKQILYLKEAI